MAARGVNVEALKNEPELLEFEEFYIELYRLTKGDPTSIKTVCDLYYMTAQETLEAIEIVNLLILGMDK